MRSVRYSIYFFYGSLAILILHIADNVKPVASVSFDEDTRLTQTQGEILEKFRQRVSSRLPHKYMEESIFLVRWLRARNFDMDRAEQMLFKNLDWRKEKRMDGIDEEDWKDFEIDFPFNTDGVDKEGRPLVQITLADWDIRSAVLTGRRERLVRWIYKFFEDGTKLVRQYQADGKNVTQFTLMLDAEGFNAVTHGCPLCIPLYLTLAGGYEEYYPGAMDKIHVVNTPEFFNVIIRLVTPLLSQDTRKALKIHGTNRQEWRKILSKEIKDSQLLPSFGGTLSNKV